MENKLDNAELVKRLAEAEEIIEVLRNHEVDAIVGKKSVLLVRLKEVEDALLQDKVHSENERQRIETLLNISPMAIVIIEKPDGKISFINERARELYGMDPVGLQLKEYPKIGLLKLDGTPYAPEEMPASRSLLQGEIVRNEELILARQDGSRIFVMASSAPLKNVSGETIAVIGTFDDITERKQTQAELGKTSLILSEGQKIAHVGSFEYIAETRTTVWSDEECRIYGVAPGTPTPDYDVMLTKFIPPGDATLLNETFTKALQSGSIYELEHRIVRPDGNIRIVYDRAFPHFDDSGKIIRYIGATLDITERKQAEESLQRYVQELKSYQNDLEDKVNQRTQELQLLSYRLIKAQEDERRNISRELHDQIGQSLTVLNLLLAKALRSPETNQPDLKEAQQSVKEILSQVRNLSTSLHPGMLEDLGLLPTLQWYLNDFGKKTGIDVKYTHSGLDRKFAGDLNITIYRVIQEALTNIARYAEVKEAVVSLKFEDQVLSIRIEDKGQGFAVESQKQGVGLRGMRERVNALKGTIRIHSAPGEGTLIEVELPVPKG
jgi:PAS domain S-box-containing protein